MLVDDVPGSVGSPRPASTASGTTTPSSRPKCESLVRPTAPCSDGVMMSLTAKRLFCDGLPNGCVPFSTSGFDAQVVTRPNEKSPRPSTPEELRVMNPFESIAGRKIWRSIGAL